jgi:hypothetical protein
MAMPVAKTQASKTAVDRFIFARGLCLPASPELSFSSPAAFMRLRITRAYGINRFTFQDRRGNRKAKQGSIAGRF